MFFYATKAISVDLIVDELSPALLYTTHLFKQNSTGMQKLNRSSREETKKNLDHPTCEDSEKLWTQTKLIFGLGIGVAAAITLLPESVSNWSDNDLSFKQLGDKWVKNVTSGPVWDEDNWAINYIGHPYFGGAYYQVARNSGYSRLKSFFYTAAMSTFYWEYGLEAFAEVPSMQDLLVTPILGSLYGEWAYHKKRKIMDQGGAVWNSTLLGSMTMFILDPVGSSANFILGTSKNRNINVEYTSFSISPSSFSRGKQGENSHMFHPSIVASVILSF